MKIRACLSILLMLNTGINLLSQADFSSPLNIPLSLSANFAELRADHYHSGIDIKTQGVTGKEVCAAADGYVYLILVSPVGFGKAIYIRHPFGLSTVYAHLDGYSPEIEEYVRYQQYRNKTFAITITPPLERLPVKKGQLIGYSGNTGGSTGPHLHFEVRKSDGEKPVDPIKYIPGITDNLKPVFERLIVYPSSPSSVINGGRKKVMIDVTGSNGNYSLSGGTGLSISGPAGFGISVYDNINDMPNRFGISSIVMKIDSLPWFTYDAGEFSFSETRYINAHIDYAARVRSNTEIERTFVLPNDKLSMYKNYMNNGLFDFTDGKIHLIVIEVTDSFGNKSVLSFSASSAGSVPAKDENSPADSSVSVMPFNRENAYSAEGIKLTLPAGSLYDTLRFTYSKVRLNGSLLSPLHLIHNRFTPLHKAARLSLKPDTIPPGKEGKLLIVQIDEKGVKAPQGGSYSGGFITTDIRAFGGYAVSVDTVPPVISANGFAENADLSGKSSIRLYIRDNLSGIKSYTCMIDGNWALFEYDAKNDLIFYRFDPKRLTQGKTHLLEVTVTDNCNNVSTLERNFTWQAGN